MVRVRLQLEVVRLGGVGALVVLAAQARVLLGEGRDGGAGGLPRLAQDVGALGQLVQVLVAVVLEEAEVDVGLVLRVGREEADRAGLRLGPHVHHRAAVLGRAVVGGEAGPEALEGEGAAPGVDVALLGRGRRGAEEEGDQARLDGGRAQGEQRALVVVAEVLADAGEVLDQRDLELGQLRRGADTAQLEDLRGVERAARDDDLACGQHLRHGALGTRDVLGVRLVQRRALHELDADGARDLPLGRVGGRRVEQHARHERVQLDRQRVLGRVGERRADVVVGAAALALGGGVRRHVVEGRRLVRLLVRLEDVAVDQVGGVGRVLARQTCHLLEDLGAREAVVLGPRVVGHRGGEPALGGGVLAMFAFIFFFHPL